MFPYAKRKWNQIKCRFIHCNKLSRHFQIEIVIEYERNEWAERRCLDLYDISWIQQRAHTICKYCRHAANCVIWALLDERSRVIVIYLSLIWQLVCSRNVELEQMALYVDRVCSLAIACAFWFFFSVLLWIGCFACSFMLLLFLFVCRSFFFFCFKSAFVHLFRFVISSYAIVIIVCRVLMVVDVGRAFVAFHLEKTPKAREKKTHKRHRSKQHVWDCKIQKLPVFQMLIASKPISCLQKSNRFGGSIRVVQMIKSKLNQLNVSVRFPHSDALTKTHEQFEQFVAKVKHEQQHRSHRINILKLQAIKTSDQKRRFFN